jgi:Caspase domain
MVFYSRMLASAVLWGLSISFSAFAKEGDVGEGVEPETPTNIAARDGNREVSYPMYRASYALVVGASRYVDPSWDNLDVVNQEVDLVKSELIRQGFSVTPVINPNSDELLKAIRGFFRTPRARDTRLLLYFAGHGFTSKKDRMGYIVPVDAPDDSASNFYEKLVSMQEIRGWLPIGQAKHVLLVFDSCFSGSIYNVRKNSKPELSEVFLNDLDRPGRQFITSGDAEEVVPDAMDFATAFVNGIRGAADYNKDALTTASELGYFLKKEIKPKGLQSPQYGTDRIDQETSTVFNGNMVFVGPTTAFPADPKLVDVALQSPDLSGPRGANLRALGDPENPAQSVFKGVEVLYYRKEADSDTIANALQDSQIPFTVTSSDLPEEFRTNGIACAPDVPVEAIKTVARTMINAGIPVRKIVSFRKVTDKPKRIEVLSFTTEGKAKTSISNPPLTLDQIDTMKACPKMLANPI